jgi:diguanylate cyclase (GGDEF)-like protein/PAS domain S-box-containing protein
MTTRTARACFGAWILVLTAMYYAWPASHLYTWAAVGYSSAAMVLLGTRLNRPDRRLPWYLIAAALACFTTGDTTYNVIVALGREPGFPGLADVLYLLVYPLLTGGFLLLVRARSGDRSNRAALLDALVPTVGLGLLSWVYWIAPFTRSDHLSLLQKLVSVGYPLGDVLVLAMTLRMLTAPGRKPPALSAISIAMSGLLISDVFYGQSRLDSAWALGGPVDLGWVIFYATMGGAALLPSMRRLGRSAAQSGPDAGVQGILWMAAAALVAPGVLLSEYLQGRQTATGPAGAVLGGVVDAPVIAGAAALMFLLVLARVNDLVVAQRRAGARERALREAGAALFAAATEQDAVHAVQRAVATVMPADRPYRLCLTDRARGVAHESSVRLITADQLPPGVSAHGFEHFLCATLPLPGPGRRLGGAMLAAPAPVLRELLPSLETLFSHIAVVIERIGLTGEVHRRDSEAYFRTLIQNASDVILIVDDHDLIGYASPSAATVFGLPELAGTALTGLIADGHHEALRDVLAGIRHGHGAPDGIDLAVTCAGGRVLRVECVARDLRDDPTVRGLVLTMRDVTEQRRLENDLSHQAFHDGLTGLANRVLFRNRLEQAYAVAERDGATIGVLFVDLDDFKEVNDTLGHAVGDELLVVVARRISQIVGAGSTAARMGGDEFAILIEQTADDLAGETVAARIVAALASPVEVGDGIGGTHIVSGAASVGLATNHDADSATELLRHADLALYQAKGEQKGTWQRYRSELHSVMVARLQTRTALSEAIDDEQFVLQYQPIVDLTDQSLGGVESLVRWRHPDRGVLSPYHFIEVAEESGAIVAIGGWVLRQALAQFTRWHADDPDISLRYVSVNVSARQFRTPGFVDQVREAIAAAGARPEWLLLEITESLLLRDAEQVWADLRTLRALGVRIAIDDFGTGYSSLSYLRQMPVDVLKLDKSFIDEIVVSDQQHALVDAIVTLARTLDLAVIAEGIEDAGQRDALRGMRCPYGQGYLFARPVWPGEIAGLARSVPQLV